MVLTILLTWSQHGHNMIFFLPAKVRYTRHPMNDVSLVTAASDFASRRVERMHSLASWQTNLRKASGTTNKEQNQKPTTNTSKPQQKKQRGQRGGERSKDKNHTKPSQPSKPEQEWGQNRAASNESTHVARSVVWGRHAGEKEREEKERPTDQGKTGVAQCETNKTHILVFCYFKSLLRTAWEQTTKQKRSLPRLPGGRTIKQRSSRGK